MSDSISYSDAGVSIDNANIAVEKIKQYARNTFNESALTEIGSFGGMFSGAFPSMEHPILVASADGVGTKLKIAFETGVHDTIGQDLVNHCVNDILVQGARPLFFLDYFATGKLSPEVTSDVVKGISIACKENGCVLLGGETAEMPGFYTDGEYDLAGFIVGVVDKKHVIDGKSVSSGDAVIGIPCKGLQTNGYSLARKLLFEIGGYQVDSYVDELGSTVGQALLQRHESFLPVLSDSLESGVIKGLAHITGGGFIENIPRILPKGVSVRIDRGAWTEPSIYGLLQKIGNVRDEEMFRTFNMGIGMVVICDKSNIRHLIDSIPGATEIGTIIEGERKVEIV